MSVCGKQHSEIGESEPNTKALGRTEKYQPNTLQIWHNTDNKLQQCPPFSDHFALNSVRGQHCQGGYLLANVRFVCQNKPVQD